MSQQLKIVPVHGEHLSLWYVVEHDPVNDADGDIIETFYTRSDAERYIRSRRLLRNRLVAWLDRPATIDGAAVLIIWLLLAGIAWGICR